MRDTLSCLWFSHWQVLLFTDSKVTKTGLQTRFNPSLPHLETPSASISGHLLSNEKGDAGKLTQVSFPSPLPHITFYSSVITKIS